MSKSPKTNRVPILVIESNADHWLIIRSALMQCFHQTEPIWMAHFTQLQAYLEKNPAHNLVLPLLILLEPTLPSRADGLAVLQFLKSQAGYTRIPIILLSHSQHQQDISDWYQAGINSYIIKSNSFNKWLTHFYTFRRYWWDLVSLPGRLVLPASS